MPVAAIVFVPEPVVIVGTIEVILDTSKPEIVFAGILKSNDQSSLLSPPVFVTVYVNTVFCPLDAGVSTPGVLLIV